eukprot:jgi/Mesvir1/439/Mv11318-RA.2
MRPDIQTEPSLTTRFQVWFGTIPLVTASVLVACVSIWFLELLGGLEPDYYVCMAPRFVVRDWQVYRVLTSPFFHAGVLHLAFNMLAFVPMSSSLERAAGSVRTAHMMLLFATLAGLLHALVVYLLASVTGHPGWAAECAVGFSGIIFALLVVDTAMSGVSHRSIFGFFQVPAKWYPWALLVFFQLLVPRASAMGHLAGLLLGEAYVRGYLNRLLLSQARVTKIETSPWLYTVANRAQFIVGGSNVGTFSSGGSSLGSGVLPSSWANPSAASGTGSGRSTLMSWLGQPRPGGSAAAQERQPFLAHGRVHGLSSSSTTTTSSMPHPSAPPTSFTPTAPASTSFPGQGRKLGGGSSSGGGPGSAGLAAMSSSVPEPRAVSRAGFAPSAPVAPGSGDREVAQGASQRWQATERGGGREGGEAYAGGTGGGPAVVPRNYPMPQGGPYGASGTGHASDARWESQDSAAASSSSSSSSSLGGSLAMLVSMGFNEVWRCHWNSSTRNASR